MDDIGSKIVGPWLPEPDELDPGTEVFWKHAENWWKAEEVNSTRISGRFGFVLAALTAIIGLKFAAIGREIEYVLYWPENVQAWYLFFSLSGIACFVFALGITVDILSPIADQERADLAERGHPVPTRTKAAASNGLRLSDEQITRSHQISEAAARISVFGRTYKAADDLANRNRKREFDLRQAQQSLMCGVGFMLILAAIFVYSYRVFGIPNQPNPSYNQPGKENVTSSTANRGDKPAGHRNDADGSTDAQRYR